MNQVIFVGRIVRSVDVKSVGMNGRVINNVIAINRYHKDSNGERVADFIPFVAWNHLADLIGRYCQKGHLIAISGRMQSRKYTNKESEDVYVIECLVDEVTLINPRTSETETNSQNQTHSSAALSDEEARNVGNRVENTMQASANS